MRFLQIVFLAFWQLTAVPFVGIITAYGLKANEQPPATNVTVAYKSSIQ